MNTKTSAAYSELERSVHLAIETYSNVHRGSGHNSIVTTHLFEQARGIVLEYLRLKNGKYCIIFCTRYRADSLMAQIEPNNYLIVTSREIGLPIGVCAMAVLKKAIPKKAYFHSGGGTAKLISREWIIWADAPDRFEAGTPAIINIIAFAKALLIIQKLGKDIFQNPVTEDLSAPDILYHDELEKYSGKELLDKLRQTLIGKGVHVPTINGLKPYINLDNSASTPTFTPIWNSFLQTLKQSEKVKIEIIQEVKSLCAGMLGATSDNYDVTFASNTTEAINLVAESLSKESEEGIEPVIINTLLEHSSNDLPWRMIRGHSLLRMTVNDEGFIDLNELETALSEYNRKGLFGKKRVKLVAITGASNVLGICNNITDISRIVHKYGAQLLIDGAQLVAHRKINIEEYGIDYFAFSAHKVYAPFGCGVLISKKGLLKFSLEEMEKIKISGEENASGIASLGKSFVLLQRIGMDLITKEEQQLLSFALKGMAQIPGLMVYGVKDPDSSCFENKVGVIVFNMNNIMPGKIAQELAFQKGIGIRYGCHCSHILIKHLLNVGPSLQKFQRIIQTLFPKLKFPGLARVSFGIENSKGDIDNLINALKDIAANHARSVGKLSPDARKESTRLPMKKFKKQVNEISNIATLKVYSKP